MPLTNDVFCNHVIHKLNIAQQTMTKIIASGAFMTEAGLSILHIAE
jgi:hypothetical protein